MDTTPSYDVSTLCAALGRPHVFAGWDCGCIAVGPPDRLRLDACERHGVLGAKRSDVYHPLHGALAS